MSKESNENSLPGIEIKIENREKIFEQISIEDDTTLNSTVINDSVIAKTEVFMFGTKDTYSHFELLANIETQEPLDFIALKQKLDSSNIEIVKTRRNIKSDDCYFLRKQNEMYDFRIVSDKTIRLSPIAINHNRQLETPINIYDFNRIIDSFSDTYKLILTAIYFSKDKIPLDKKIVFKINSDLKSIALSQHRSLHLERSYDGNRLEKMIKDLQKSIKLIMKNYVKLLGGKNFMKNF
jgi:hypothetical protein